MILPADVQAQIEPLRSEISGARAEVGLAAHNEPLSYWDIIRRENPRKAVGRGAQQGRSNYI